jgi:hypothetical protein
VLEVVSMTSQPVGSLAARGYSGTSYVMADAGIGQHSAGGFVVLREVGDGTWQLVGEAGRRPGLRAAASRVQAVQDVEAGAGIAGQAYAVVLRSEWRVAQPL